MPDIPRELWFVALGAALTFVGEWLRDLRFGRREREARAAEAAARSEVVTEERARRRDEFQRATLLDLQDAAMRLARTVGAMYGVELRGYRQTGKWGATVGDELSEENRVGNQQTTLLTVRVLDDEVRALMREYKNATSTCALAGSKEEADAALALAIQTFDRMNERIGVLLRQLN